ncbi:maleylpyruvate isomerase family mycothiol-dependent enzyme [Gordonia sp. NB41Y]|uniref:maleylpyruvate isomerase family mycothiol-dependent enzyme n=1 Tax=Gordonia sp. NB41Y TaxID=875808 RepID=UPI00273C0A79|nr:maleylpyruvate isomerase family mycothiol-dependent enzyme [Gordonia sp. NB41Y]WLP90312.1 maleylpyruvate isomerase family mycothiol-dependent enzyme [Gordonia sp. NB41Y]
MARTIVPVVEITGALIAQWAAIREVAARLSAQQWTAPSILPGWSDADIVAHIIGTESMLAGRDVDAPAGLADRDHVHNPIAELNEKWVEHFRGHTQADVLAALDEITAVRTAALQAMTQTDFDAEALTPAGTDTYGRFMRIRVFDCWFHEIDLRDGSGAGTPTDPVPAGFALDELAASLPFVVGKRAGAPDGSRVVIEVTGLAPRTVRIAVDGRAGLVEAFPGGDATADVTLTVDGVDLARLAGGRRSADPASVTVTGDAGLAAAILDTLNYTI